MYLVLQSTLTHAVAGPRYSAIAPVFVRWDSTVITNQCRYSTQAYDTGNPRLSQVSAQGSDKQYCSSLCTQVTQVECHYTAGHLPASPLRLLSPYQ